MKSVCNILQAPFKNQYLDIGFKNKEDWVWSLIYYVLLGYNSTIHTVWVKRYEAGATLIKVLENLLKEANSLCSDEQKATLLVLLKKWTYCLVSTLEDQGDATSIPQSVQDVLVVNRKLLDTITKFNIPLIPEFFEENVQVRMSVHMSLTVKKLIQKAIYNKQGFEDVQEMIKQDNLNQYTVQKFYTMLLPYVEKLEKCDFVDSEAMKAEITLQAIGLGITPANSKLATVMNRLSSVIQLVEVLKNNGFNCKYVRECCVCRKRQPDLSIFGKCQKCASRKSPRRYSPRRENIYNFNTFEPIIEGSSGKGTK